MAHTYTRVKDKATGHEYDVLEHKFDAEKHESLRGDRYPDVAQPRPAKHYVGKGGNAPSRRRRSSGKKPAPRTGDTADEGEEDAGADTADPTT